MSILLAYFTCGFIGIVVGAAELFGRYRDQPAALLTCPSGWIYVLLNGAASLAVLYLTDTYGWSFGIQGSGNALLSHVLIASFGAMAVLRTSIFNVKVENEIVPIGPSVILVALLGAADRGVDRARAVKRSECASRVMRSIEFNKAQAALPTFCLALLQNPNPAEQQKLRDAVKALHENSEMTNSQKSMSLGLLLMNLVGPKGLMAAVEALGSEIAIEDTAASVPKQARRKRYASTKEHGDSTHGSVEEIAQTRRDG